MQPIEWRPVLGYEGMYLVSNYGEVMNTLYGRRRKLKPEIRRGGYGYVKLYRDGTSRNFAVHRLVAVAFLDGEHEGLEVCHGDDDPSNNYVENLRWDTRSGNMQDRYREGKPRLCRQGHPMGFTKNGNSRCYTCYRARYLLKLAA